MGNYQAEGDMSLLVKFTNAHTNKDILVDATKISIIEQDQIETGKIKIVKDTYPSGDEYEKKVPIMKDATKLNMDFAVNTINPKRIRHKASRPQSIYIVEEPHIVQSRIEAAQIEREINIRRAAGQAGLKL